MLIATKYLTLNTFIRNQKENKNQFHSFQLQLRKAILQSSKKLLLTPEHSLLSFIDSP